MHQRLRAQPKTFFADGIKSWQDARKNASQSRVTIKKSDVICF